MGLRVKRLQTEIPKRLAQDDFKAEAKQIDSACKAEEDRGYQALSTYAQAHHFALMRDEGHMVFTLRDAQGEPGHGRQGHGTEPTAASRHRCGRRRLAR